MEVEQLESINLGILKKKVGTKTVISFGTLLAITFGVYEYFFSNLMPSFDNIFLSIVFTLFVLFCLFVSIYFLCWVFFAVKKARKTVTEMKENMDTLMIEQNQKSVDAFSEATNNINNDKILNPYLDICECKSEYRQISQFEYENKYFLTIKARKTGLCDYILRYSWDGSEQDYLIEAFEDDGAGEKKITAAEYLTDANENGIRTFVAIFNSNKEGDTKHLQVRFYKLKDSQGIAKKNTFYGPFSNTCEKITIEVFLLEDVLFYKKVIDASFDQPREYGKKILSTSPSKTCSWSVHDDESVNKIKEKEKYFVYWE